MIVEQREIPPSNNDDNEPGWFRRLPPVWQLRLSIFAGVVAIVWAVVIRIHWHTWGQPLLIAVSILACIFAIYRTGRSNERKSLDHQHKMQSVEHPQHYRDLSTQALIAGHSVQLKHKDHFGNEWEFATVSPMTIPNGPMSIENYYATNQPKDEGHQIPEHASSEYMDISPDYRPHADEILSSRVTIFGVSDAGKSNTFAIFAEELGKFGTPLLIGDTEDEYESLDSPLYLPNAQKVDSSLVNTVNAEEFGRYILDARLQAILNLADYSPDEAAQVMILAIKGMYEWEQEKSFSERVSCMYMLDEAGKWLPQNAGNSILSPEIQNELFNSVSGSVVSRGRKRGIGAILANQRIAVLNKDVLQPSVQVLHRQTQDVDIKRYKGMGVDDNEVASLINGEAYIFAARVVKLRTRINKRRSPHGANTPGLASLRRGNAFGESFGFLSDVPKRTEILSGDFVEPVEPIENVSEFRNSPKNRGYQDVPENIRAVIANRYYQGQLRTKIHEELNLNDDQYWMVKVVCDRIDRLREEEAMRHG